MNLKDYQDKSFIRVSSWGGLGPNPGSSGYLVTNEGEIVSFRVNFKAPENEREELKVMSKLSTEQVNDFKKYLKEEEKVFTTDYKEPMIFDVGTTVVVNIDGQKREIQNESSSFTGELGKKMAEIISKDKELREVTSKMSSEEAYEKIIKDYGLEELRRSEEKLYDRIKRKIKEKIKN